MAVLDIKVTAKRADGFYYGRWRIVRRSPCGHVWSWRTQEYPDANIEAVMHLLGAERAAPLALWQRRVIARRL